MVFSLTQRAISEWVKTFISCQISPKGHPITHCREDISFYSKQNYVIVSLSHVVVNENADAVIGSDNFRAGCDLDTVGGRSVRSRVG